MRECWQANRKRLLKTLLKRNGNTVTEGKKPDHEKQDIIDVMNKKDKAKDNKTKQSATNAVQEALRNCAMEDQDSMMIDNYAVIVSQYTYIVLWSVAFPLAPLFAFLVNFMQIRGEIKVYCLSTKRAMPEMNSASVHGVLLSDSIVVLYQAVMIISFALEKCSELHK